MNKQKCHACGGTVGKCPCENQEEHDDGCCCRICQPKRYERVGNGGQPQATDFTEIVASVTKDGEYAVRVLLDSGIKFIATSPSRREAETIELVINQAMIEYRTKRNAWEKQVSETIDSGIPV